MRGWRHVLPRLALAAVAGACAREAGQSAQQEAAEPARGTTEWKIQNAMSAAPEAIASAATIMAWPSSPDSQPTELRAGTNGWTCFADNEASPGEDPMCFDGQFGNWATAWMSRRNPSITSLGVAYMLKGGSDASNTDPFKMQPDSGQAWVETGPHVMIVVPNVSGLAGLPTDHSSGGPYIMWQGTPYAHVMVPIRPVRQRNP
jgi:hypothetical protein